MIAFHALRRSRRTRSLLLLALASWLLLGFTVSARPAASMQAAMGMGDHAAACCQHPAGDGVGMAHCHCAGVCANVLPPVAVAVHQPMAWQVRWAHPAPAAPQPPSRPPLRPPQA